MDGHFVPNLTIGPPVVEAIRKRTRLPLDVHLMIEEPERWVETYVRAGADSSPCTPRPARTSQRVAGPDPGGRRPAGGRAQPLDAPEVLEYVLDDLDLVLVMSVNPGFGGQLFIPTAYRRSGDSGSCSPAGRSRSRWTAASRSSNAGASGRRPGPGAGGRLGHLRAPPIPAQADPGLAEVRRKYRNRLDFSRLVRSLRIL